MSIPQIYVYAINIHIFMHIGIYIQKTYNGKSTQENIFESYIYYDKIMLILVVSSRHTDVICKLIQIHRQMCLLTIKINIFFSKCKNFPNTFIIIRQYQYYQYVCIYVYY